MTTSSWNTLDPHIRQQLVDRLSRRQHDVLILWLAGCSIERIATMLTLAPRTVRTHLARARQIYDQIRKETAV